jgi:hypothetical protein|tara:strand:+ start:246 stop:413 length:168 start_codon:yes stop_codon:yes gene_type:complete
MTKIKEQQKERQEYILDWEEYSKQNNVYSWLAYILYVILFIPMLIAWIIIEYRKE